jgi:methyl-accepting chemotaxis protein
MDTIMAPTASKARGLVRMFTNRKIATKIALGFAGVLAITVMIASTAFFEFSRVGHEFELFGRRAGVVNLARTIDREFLALRRAVLAYIIEPNDEMAKAARDRDQIVTDVLARAVKTIQHPERLERVKHISEQAALYRGHFDTLARMRSEQQKLTSGVLDPTGLSLRTEIEQLQSWVAAKGAGSNGVILAGEALKHLMLARLNVNKMLARHEDAAAKGAEKAFADLKSSMAALSATFAGGDGRKLFDEVDANVRKYADAYAKAAHDSHEVDVLYGQVMRKLGETIDADSQFVGESAAADEKQIEHEMVSAIASAERFVAILAVISIVIGAAFAWLIARSISRPTRAIGAVLVALSEGNKTVDVPFTDRGDEIGDNARAALTFKDNLVRMERMEAEQREADTRAAEEKRLADAREAAQQRAAEEKAAADRKVAMHALADEFERAVGAIIDSVSTASTELEAAANTLTSTAATTQQLSTVVASASEEASTNVQSVASATEEMTGSIGEISRQVQESSTIAGSAVTQAQMTDARIGELSQAASRIGDVVKLITAIAEQTNLLALNATIEAARAGEAGKGFAVVASEVKALAAQTAKATGEIGTQIAGMQTATQVSVTAIKEIGGTIDRISSIAATIAAAVEQQGAATAEIARNVQEAAKGTAEVATNIVNVNHGAAATGSASSQVLSSAQSLARESNHLKTEVHKFLQTVRAA